MVQPPRDPDDDGRPPRSTRSGRDATARTDGGPAGDRPEEDRPPTAMNHARAVADALYALNLPPELQVPVADIARRVGADLAFTTLGGDPATVPTRPATVPGGTLHWLRRTDGA